MLDIDSKAVVLDFEKECCGGFENGTVVQVVSVEHDGHSICYECRSLSRDVPNHDILLWQCDKCLVPIKDQMEL